MGGPFPQANIESRPQGSSTGRRYGLSAGDQVTLVSASPEFRAVSLTLHQVDVSLSPDCPASEVQGVRYYAQSGGADIYVQLSLGPGERLCAYILALSEEQGDVPDISWWSVAGASVPPGVF